MRLTTLVSALGAVAMVLGLLGVQPAAGQTTFAPGDVFVSTSDGQVQWRRADGTLNRVLVSTVAGPAEGMRLDPASNLYVAHWCATIDVTSACSVGNTVEKFDPHGVSVGTVGSGYNCNPHALAFDAAGTIYVGQADCTGNILELPLGQPPIAYAAAAENRGSFWIDLADRCTVLYTSIGPDVKRFDVCANAQRPDFNLAPLPGGVAHDLRALPDGGVLVSSGNVIARLDATGALVQTYATPESGRYWGGLDLVGDGTFWAADYYSSDVYRFDLGTGAARASFNTGTSPQSVVGVAVVKVGALVCP
jgi:outer membrane protein assembly factor BamB